MLEEKNRKLLNGANSEWQRVGTSIPQSSVLGPIPFLLFINNLYAAMAQLVGWSQSLRNLLMMPS
jgi:hypothetical protein